MWCTSMQRNSGLWEHQGNTVNNERALMKFGLLESHETPEGLGVQFLWMSFGYVNNMYLL